MDDLYGDLNNYEDVNSAHELRIENKELKVKLQEHAAAMEKLQKDYDTLEMEFKKLENNYSSLLKTARAEIERKTQRISQLNIEKDMVILNALKNGKHIRRNLTGTHNPSKLKYDNPYKVKVNMKEKEDNIIQKNVNTNSDGHKTTVLQTKDLPSDTNNCHKNKIEKEVNSKKNNFKENTAHHKTEFNDNPKKINASNIKNRRKSMPAVRPALDTFSSDDEQNFPTKDTKTDNLPMDKFQRKDLKIAVDRYSNKTSETSSLDDRSNNYHESSSRDFYKGRSSKYHDNTSYRGRDKYEVSLKYRKQYSPERGQKRQYREHQDDYYRQDKARYHGKSLQSPPPECYSRHQRRNLDQRSDYDRHFHEQEKYRPHYEERYTGKYRLQKDYDEPHSKRPKTESYEGHFREDTRYCHDKDSADVNPIPEFSLHEYDILRYSCQSPDSVQTDAAFATPKEIMATAATPLDDPRLTSKRYVIKKSNGKEILSTVVGRNVAFKLMPKANWNINHVDIPVALVRRPSQTSDEFDIYKDIDYPVTNLNISMESGEICEVEHGSNKIVNKPKEVMKHDSQEFQISDQVTEGIFKKVTNTGDVAKPGLITKYRIPKIGHNNKHTQNKIDVPIIDVSEIIPHNKNGHKKDEAEDCHVKETLTRKQQVNDSVNLPSSHINNSKQGGKSEIQNHAMLSNMAIVADDLELSDDNSDNVDSNRQIVPMKVQKKCKSMLKINEDVIENSTKSDYCSSSHDNVTDKTGDNTVMKDKVEEVKTTESDNTKKQKIKKKKLKSKEVFTDSVDNKDATSEKKSKSKKEKECTKETKEKFSDLFGDSSSLMTPEDLGIPSYIPISEDAQDAVDMKINQIIDNSPLIDEEKISSFTQTQNTAAIKEQDIIRGEDNCKDMCILNTEHKEVVEDVGDTKNKSSRNNEAISESIQLPSPIIYENLNPETDSNDANVVKTVIISTGVQPEVRLQNNEHLAEPIPNTTGVKQILAGTEFKRHDILNALATSTPQKDCLVTNLIQDVSEKPNDNCANFNKTKPNAEQAQEQTDKNALDSHDAPDVRIFVKRRRKAVKRPPMT